MCEFCSNIVRCSIYSELQGEEVPFPQRQKLILVKTREQGYMFYGFSAYACEDIGCFLNVKANFCPICGRDLKR